MEPFKNIFNKDSIQLIGSSIAKSSSQFDLGRFEKEANKGLKNLEMKDRVRHISTAIHSNLSMPYEQQIQVLIESLCDESLHQDSEWQGDDLRNAGVRGFLVWPLTHFVETYGLEQFDHSMLALYEMTKRFTSEFAIRPFIESDPKKAFQYLKTWRKDPNDHVRRLVSEGTRPNLPWGLKVNWIHANLPKNISLISPLVGDRSEYVRRSVANHMNDITRIDANLALETLESWQKKKTVEFDSLQNRALRSLLKAGHPRALKQMGFNPRAKIEIKKFAIDKTSLNEGESLNATVKIKNPANTNSALMIDYIIHYQKKNNQLSEKVFKWKKVNLKGGETIEFSKKIDFKKVTTRKHYSGTHYLQLQVNGQKLQRKKFNLDEVQ